MTIFLWISIINYFYNTKYQYTLDSTSKQLFLTIIMSVSICSFVFSSLRSAITNTIAICLELFLCNNILSYLLWHYSWGHPALFPSNIQHKHCPNLILCHFVRYSSWRFISNTMDKKITFWIRICTASCCNTIFWPQTHCKYEPRT